MKKFKIFEEEKPDEALEKMRELTKKPDNYEIYNKSLLKKMSNRNFGRNQSQDALYKFETKMAVENNQKKSMLANMSTTLINEEDDFMTNILEEKTIFSQQIQVEPPDLPNAHSSSPIAPGLGWAPSIPFLMNDHEKIDLKDLLIRAKAGMQAGEVQKEAHLSFYLGITFENNKKYKKSISYFKKYFNCAKSLEDKIGMAFAMNRIGINYHKFNDHEKSVEYHQKNIELSDFENIFAGYYNSGISLRF